LVVVTVVVVTVVVVTIVIIVSIAVAVVGGVALVFAIAGVAGVAVGEAFAVGRALRLPGVDVVRRGGLSITITVVGGVARLVAIFGVDVVRRGGLGDRAASLLRPVAWLRGCACRPAGDGRAKSVCRGNRRCLRDRLPGGGARGPGRTRALFVLAALRTEQQRRTSRSMCGRFADTAGSPTHPPCQRNPHCRRRRR